MILEMDYSWKVVDDEGDLHWLVLSPHCNGNVVDFSHSRDDTFSLHNHPLEMGIATGIPIPQKLAVNWSELRSGTWVLQLTGESAEYARFHIHPNRREMYEVATCLTPDELRQVLPIDLGKKRFTYSPMRFIGDSDDVFDRIMDSMDNGAKMGCGSRTGAMKISNEVGDQIKAYLELTYG